jgi:hypothetical protein
MNPLRADFAELYQRHLCRHSQYGNNVIHFICVIGTYWALYGCALSLGVPIGVLLGVATVYAAILAFNLPLRVFLVTLVFLGLFFAALVYLPVLPFWVYLLTIYPFYKVQSWSHRIYDRAFDMTEFDKKYPKGFALFFLLSTYELPIQLNALVLDIHAQRLLVPAGAPMSAAANPERG